MRKLTTLGVSLVAAALFTALATAAAPAHRHDMSAMSGSAASQKLAAELALSRLATAKYATNLALAKKNGYGVITQMIPDMGWHFMNPKITTFDITKPPILVYGKRGSSWQLVASSGSSRRSRPRRRCPARRTARSGRRATTRTGRSSSRRARSRARRRAPRAVRAFNFWHPDLVTMHVWAGTRTRAACSPG